MRRIQVEVRKKRVFVSGSEPVRAINPSCSGCGGPHPFDTTVPSDVWNKVVRARNLPEYLCLTCIVSVFAEAGESFSAELWGKAFDGLPIYVEIGGAASLRAQVGEGM